MKQRKLPPAGEAKIETEEPLLRKIRQLSPTLAQVFTPLDDAFMQGGDYVWTFARNMFFDIGRNLSDSEPLCFPFQLAIILIFFSLALPCMICNLWQALIRTLAQKGLGDPTPPLILWRNNMLMSSRERER